MAKKTSILPSPGPSPFTLFGVSCHLNDYRLSYLLNSKLELEFIKMDDFQGFSFYLYQDEEFFTNYYLLSNRTQESILFPELKQTDFLLLTEGPMKKFSKEELLKNIRGIPHVLTAFEIRPQTIKNYETMLNDLEIHYMKIKKSATLKYSPTKK